MPGHKTSIAVCPLASGSRGNAYWIEANGTAALVDAGISLRQLTYRVADIGRDIRDVEHVFLTHEHKDHVQGLAMLLKKHRPTVWASGGTLRALRGVVPEGASVRRLNGAPEVAGAFSVHPLPVSHDAAEPLAFRFEAETGSVAVVTDLGRWDGALAEALGGPDLLVCEANHDPEMLARGPYPPVLKRRIASPRGHLNNEAGAGLAAAAVARGTRRVLLAHLSEENNSPSLAIDTVGLGVQRNGGSTTIEVATQRTPGPWLELG